MVRSFGSLLKLNHSTVSSFSLPLKSLLPNRNRRILFAAPPARNSFFYNQHHLAPYRNGIPLHCVSHPHGYSLRPSGSVPPSVFPRTAVHNLRLLMVTSQVMSPLCVVLPPALCTSLSRSRPSIRTNTSKSRPRLPCYVSIVVPTFTFRFMSVSSTCFGVPTIPATETSGFRFLHYPHSRTSFPFVDST